MTNIPLTVPVKVSVQDLTYKVNVSTAIQVVRADPYEGDYTVTPSLTEQILETNGKVMENDVTVHAMKKGLATLPIMSFVADPNISFDKTTGKITATVSGNEEITPQVEEGYISEGTPGKIGYFGNKTLKLDGLSGGTIRPRLYGDYTVRKYYYLTGDYVFKSVTVDGLTADKVVEGNVVRIGDELDPEHIMRVEGTAVVPSGTKQVAITKNGTVTEDVTRYENAEIITNVPASEVDTGTKSINSNGTHDVVGYASASVNVPNSYSQSDEGKVVSNGALVSQTSDTVTANDTYDTTLINSLTVNVSGGGFDWNRIAQNLEPYGDAVITSGTKIGDYAFSRKPVTSVYSDTSGVATKLGSGCFAYCSSLTKVILKYCTQSENNSTSCQFQGARMHYIALPRYSAQFNANAAQGSYVQIADIGSATTIATKAFSGSNSFNTLILRRSDGLTSLANSNGIAERTAFGNGGTGGTIYIPKVLFDHLGDGSSLDYKSATNWSTVDGFGTITWAVLEGSAYESMDWADNL